MCKIYRYVHGPPTAGSKRGRRLITPPVATPTGMLNSRSKLTGENVGVAVGLRVGAVGDPDGKRVGAVVGESVPATRQRSQIPHRAVTTEERSI